MPHASTCRRSGMPDVQSARHARLQRTSFKLQKPVSLLYGVADQAESGRRSCTASCADVARRGLLRARSTLSKVHSL